MAISGHTSPQLVINSTGNVQTYSGNATVGSSSDLVIIMVQAWDANALEDPVNWTVTLGGGSALTASTTGFNTGIDFAVAVYEVTSPPTGTPAVAVDLGGAGRGCQALVWVISGHDTTTPVAGRGESTSYSSDVATRAFTRTTTANNNVLLSMLGVKETVTTSEFSMTGGTLISAANTGTGDTTDITCAYGYHVVATAGSTTDTYNWTDTGRAHVAWVEINVATSGTTDGVGSASGAATASGTGAATAAASGASSGAGTASASGASIAAATGSSAGSSAVSGISGAGATVSGAGSASGAATASAAGAAVIGAAGAASGSGAASGAGTGIAAASGAAAGVAGGTAVGRSFSASVASSAGGSVAISVGASVAAAIGVSSAGATVIGLTADLSGVRARYPAASANTVTVHSETRQSAVIGTTRTVRIV